MILNFHPSTGFLPSLSGGLLRALFHCESTLPHLQPPHRMRIFPSLWLSLLWPSPGFSLLLVGCATKTLSSLEFKPFLQIPSFSLLLPPLSWSLSLIDSPGSQFSLPTLPSLYSYIQLTLYVCDKLCNCLGVKGVVNCGRSGK